MGYRWDIFGICIYIYIVICLIYGCGIYIYIYIYIYLLICVCIVHIYIYVDTMRIKQYSMFIISIYVCGKYTGLEHTNNIYIYTYLHNLSYIQMLWS